jgi:hypothetical protein
VCSFFTSPYSHFVLNGNPALRGQPAAAGNTEADNELRSADKQTPPVTVTACRRNARSYWRDLLEKLKANQNEQLNVVRTVPAPNDRFERFSG